jgi:hypothetical protein
MSAAEHTRPDQFEVRHAIRSAASAWVDASRDALLTAIVSGTDSETYRETHAKRVAAWNAFDDVVSKEVQPW